MPVFRRALALALCLALFSSCEKVTQPPYREVVRLEGAPYDRGLQHGKALKSRIRAFYTTMLTTSLLPFLNREQPDIAATLTEYQKERYANGQFSYQLLLDSAKELEKSIPKQYREEMRGIADGAELPYEQILVLNTFVDTVLAVRGVAFAIKLAQAPVIEKVEVLGAEKDGVDNDADGSIDEAGEAAFAYAPSATATLVELPAAAQLRFTLMDKDGVDPATLRLQLNERIFEANDPAIASAPGADAAHLVVTFTPPEPLAAASMVTLSIGAGDKSLSEDPPPAHARFMREERLTFTVRGAGKAPSEVPNTGYDDGRTQPPSIAFALRGKATADGAPLLAQHFALLDANSSHRHTAVFIHKPDKGEPFAIVGWAGVVWGFSGVSMRGVGLACNSSDTLDNSVVAGLLEQISDFSNAKLSARGVPIGIASRRVLEEAKDVDGAVEVMRSVKHTYGWNCLYADEKGGLRSVEADADVSNDSGGVYVSEPDPTAKGSSSVNGDDLRAAVHFQRNTEDMFTLAVAGQRIQPQRFWSSAWFRSLRAFDRVGKAIADGYGSFDVASAEALLSRPDLVDQRDSMNAVVIEPKARRLHEAMGTVPATDSPFETLDLAAEVSK